LPAVFFCLGGKDRTGCFAAFILGLLGVSNADIVADYALSQGITSLLEARRPHPDGVWAESERWKSAPSELRDAPASAMEALIAHVHQRWGSWEGYASFATVDDHVVARLRSELLVEQTSPPK
jgi:protein-tyrosine phosphatase